MGKGWWDQRCEPVAGGRHDDCCPTFLGGPVCSKRARQHLLCFSLYARKNERDHWHGVLQGYDGQRGHRRTKKRRQQVILAAQISTSDCSWSPSFRGRAGVKLPEIPAAVWQQCSVSRVFLFSCSSKRASGSVRTFTLQAFVSGIFPAFPVPIT